MDLMYIGFGILQATPEQIQEFSDKINKFISYEGEAIFITFVGGLNHWVILVSHKTIEMDVQKTRLYFIDSVNFPTLDKANNDLPRTKVDYFLARAELGVKLADQFTLKMYV